MPKGAGWLAGKQGVPVPIGLRKPVGGGGGSLLDRIRKKRTNGDDDDDDDDGSRQGRYRTLE